MSSTQNKLELARTLEQHLWATGINYGDPPRLWRVAPTWYFLWEHQWQQVQEFGQLLPRLRWMFDGDKSLTYLRADFTLNRQGNLVLLELNGTPVWDFGTQVVRQTYHRILGLQGDDSDPFPGAAKEIARTLENELGIRCRRLIIFLGPERVSYQAEYEGLACFFRTQSIGARVTTGASSISPGDVVYRTFTKNQMPPELRKMFIGKRIEVWPPFSQLEEKSWMAKIFVEPNLLQSLDEETRKAIQRFVPWTWPVDHHLKINFGKRVWQWSDDELIGPRLTNPAKPDKSGRFQWVLKPIQSGQGKGTVFSSLLPTKEWREALLRSLFSVNGQGATHVLQEEVDSLRHRVTYIHRGHDRGDSLIEESNCRVRLCITYLVKGDTVETIDADATLRNHPLVHGASDAVILPVVVRKRR